MKSGTLYARKLKRAQSRFRGSAAPDAGETADLIEHLIIAVLSQETSIAHAEKALRQLREDMVDYNELRVSSPAEISASIQRHVPHPVQRAKSLIRLLNAIYRNQYAVSLDAITGKGVREVKTYLDKLDGITPYVSAYLLLWCLGGHAVPVNDLTLDMLRREELVDPAADTAEVQSFLERHVSAADAKDFSRDIAAYAAAKGRSTTASSDGRAANSSRSKSGGGTSRKTPRKGRRKPAAKSATTRKKSPARARKSTARRRKK